MFNFPIKEIKNGLGSLFVLLSALLVVLIVFLGVSTFNKLQEMKYIGQDVPQRNTITVTGTGEAFAKPDLALTSFSVITEGNSVANALNQNASKMNAVIDYLKKQGVEDKDLKTTGFNISPRYEFGSETVIFPPSGKRTLVGYDVTQSLEVKIRDMAKVGELVEGAAKAGANQIGSLQFTIDNEDDVKSKARGEAITKAKEQAKQMADQLGVKLVRITNFQESSGGFPIFFGAEKAVGMGGSTDAAPQIETGENKIESTVTITYEIN